MTQIHKELAFNSISIYYKLVRTCVKAVYLYLFQIGWTVMIVQMGITSMDNSSSKLSHMFVHTKSDKNVKENTEREVLSPLHTSPIAA